MPSWSPKPRSARWHRTQDPAAVRLLSAREIEVLSLLPTLLSLEEIADELDITINTVKSHSRAIYTKLGVSSRRGAVVAAHERGLLHVRPPAADINPEPLQPSPA